MHLCMRPGVWACLFLVMGQCQYARDGRMSNFLRATVALVCLSVAVYWGFLFWLEGDTVRAGFSTTSLGFLG